MQYLYQNCQLTNSRLPMTRNHDALSPTLTWFSRLRAASGAAWRRFGAGRRDAGDRQRGGGDQKHSAIHREPLVFLAASPPTPCFIVSIAVCLSKLSTDIFEAPHGSKLALRFADDRKVLSSARRMEALRRLGRKDRRGIARSRTSVSGRLRARIARARLPPAAGVTAPAAPKPQTTDEGHFA